jgi:hypothetical protein
LKLGGVIVLLIISIIVGGGRWGLLRYFNRLE